MDVIFMLLALLGCFVGISSGRNTRNHIFQISFVFLIFKAYIELCVTSQFRYLRSKSMSRENSAETNLENRPTFVGQSDV